MQTNCLYFSPNHSKYINISGKQVFIFCILLLPTAAAIHTQANRTCLPKVLNSNTNTATADHVIFHFPLPVFCALG